MIVCMMRHGEAEPYGERHLTREGSDQVSMVLELAKKMGLGVNSIISSPVARARESSEIAKNVFHVDYAIANALEPEGSPEEIYEELSKHNPGNAVLLVSHQPLVSRFLTDILGADIGVDFRRGSLAIVRGNPAPGGCALVSFFPPRIAIS